MNSGWALLHVQGREAGVGEAGGARAPPRQGEAGSTPSTGSTPSAGHRMGRGEGGVGQPVAPQRTTSTPTYSASFAHACASKTTKKTHLGLRTYSMTPGATRLSKLVGCALSRSVFSLWQSPHSACKVCTLPAKACLGTTWSSSQAPVSIGLNVWAGPSRRRAGRSSPWTSCRNLSPPFCATSGAGTTLRFRGTSTWFGPAPSARNTGALTTRPRRLLEGNALVLSALEIFDPLMWVIENPATGLLKTRPFMERLLWVDVTHCKYGTPNRKQTRLWTNMRWTRRSLCRPGSRCEAWQDGRHLRAAQRGLRLMEGQYERVSQSRELLYSVPAALCEEIARAATEAGLSLRLIRRAWKKLFPCFCMFFGRCHKTPKMVKRGTGAVGRTRTHWASQYSGVVGRATADALTFKSAPRNCSCDGAAPVTEPFLAPATEPFLAPVTEPLLRRSLQLLL